MKKSMIGFLVIILSLLFFQSTLFSQSLSHTYDSRYIDIVNRSAILSYSTNLHPFRYDIRSRQLFDIAQSFPLEGGYKDRLFIQNSFNEYVPSEALAKGGSTSKRYILNTFYKSPAHMLEVNQPGFMLRINPILDLKLGKGSIDGENYFLNTRGIEIRGTIDNKVHFYSNILENQGDFPDYVRRFFDKTNALPGEGFVKNYTSEGFGVENGYDWLDANAYVEFQASTSIGITFGHTKNFIGDGYRSMILSDFGDNYLNMKINWRIGKKLHYQNLFAELAGNSTRDLGGDERLVKKYMTTHTLSYSFSPKFNLYLTETVMFGRDNGFDLQYLNPIIFYRSVEGSIGSPDNVILGLGGKYNIANQFQLYGQFMLDEFKFEEIKAGNGWWANKFSAQLGAKWINVFGVDHLDGQIEYNVARPYMYSHRDSTSSYAHFNQPLAHPLGANFREVIVKGRYQVGAKWFFDATLMYASVGEDAADTNFGNNILVSHNTRGAEYGNTILQGVRSDILLGKLDISYMWKHNVFFDLSFIYRDQKSDDPSRNYNSTIINGGFRMNIKKREHIF